MANLTPDADVGALPWFGREVWNWYAASGTPVPTGVRRVREAYQVVSQAKGWQVLPDVDLEVLQEDEIEEEDLWGDATGSACGGATTGAKKRATSTERRKKGAPGKGRQQKRKPAKESCAARFHRIVGSFEEGQNKFGAMLQAQASALQQLKLVKVLKSGAVKMPTSKAKWLAVIDALAAKGVITSVADEAGMEEAGPDDTEADPTRQVPRLHHTHAPFSV